MKATSFFIEINADGMTCTTVNPVKKPDRRKMGGLKYISKMIKWEKAESERQTFEIEHECEEDVCGVEIPLSLKTRCGLIPGTTHEAQIVNGKAVIK